MNALAALGAAPEKPTFPAVVGCPLCHAETLYLFDDLGTDGIWMHCETCRAHGDIITFGAQIWNTSLASALTRFAELGAIVRNEGERAAGEYSRALGRMTAAETFWEETQGQLWNHHDDIIACRLRELGLEKDLAACRGLIGVAHPDQIASFCSEVGRAAPARAREHGPSLVFPFYDLPGRITGVLLVQYTDSFQSRRAFIPLTNYKRRKPDAGYYFLHTALAPVPRTLRDSYFVVDDPFWALKAQMAQLKSGASLLPIAASYHGPDALSYGNTWISFPHTPRFFQGAVCSPELVSQAAAARGYVCVTPQESIERTATPTRTIHRLAEIRRSAQTWQQALEEFFSASSELMAHAFATKLTVPHDKLHLFFKAHEKKFSPEFAGRVMARVEAPPVVPTKVHRRWVVIERDGGWWSHTGVHVCNALVRIKQIVHVRGGNKFYSGTISAADGELTFTDSAKKIEKMGLLAYAQQHAAAEKILVRYDPAWNVRSHLISMTLHEPELVTVSGALGWDEQSSRFCFYSYSLANDGAVVPDPVPGVRSSRQGDFPLPDIVAPLSLRNTLTISEDNAFVWAVFAAVAADLLAPVLGKPAPIVALEPTSFDAAQKIGAALDCGWDKIPARSYRHVMDSVVGAVNTAVWPVFVSHAYNDTFCSPAVPRCIAGPGFVRLEPTCAAAAPSYGWHSCTLRPPAQTPDASPLRYVLPVYLQAALRSRLTFFTGIGSPWLAVLEHLAGWLDETYGGTFNMALARNRVIPPSRAHEALMGAVNQALTVGQLDILPRPRRKDQPRNYLLRNKQHWWLNQHAIDRYFYSTGKLAPNWLSVQELLETNRLFCGTNTVHNMLGILVHREWGDRFWSDYRPDQAKDLG
jgi:hypothetical protein